MDDLNESFAAWINRPPVPVADEEPSRYASRVPTPRLQPSPKRKRRAVLVDGQKACASCRQVKTAEEFYAVPHKSDGRRDSCKACDVKRVARLREKKPRSTSPSARKYATEDVNRMAAVRLAHEADLYPPSINAAHPKPKTWGECESQRLGSSANPCPFVSCKYNLYLDVTPAGNIRIAFPEREVWELPQTCALHVASKVTSEGDTDDMTLVDVGRLIRVTRERVRQISDGAIAKIAKRQDGAAIREFLR